MGWLYVGWRAGRGTLHYRAARYKTRRGDVKIPPLKLVTFCSKTSNVCWWSFVDKLHPHHMLGSKVTWVMTASCCYTILGNVFLLNEGTNLLQRLEY